jgi:hypothetical protein
VGLEEPGVEVVPAPHNTELTDVITHTGRHRAGRALLCVIYAPLLSVHLVGWLVVYQPRSFNLASRSGCTFPEPAAAALKLVRVMRLVLSVNNLSVPPKPSSFPRSDPPRPRKGRRWVSVLVKTNSENPKEIQQHTHGLTHTRPRPNHVTCLTILPC